MSTRQQLRSLIANGPSTAAECYSAMTARIVEDVGAGRPCRRGHLDPAHR
jgi:hypothetical protein